MILGKNLVQIIIDTNDDITPEAKKAAVDYLAALREAGEKMALQLRILSKTSYFTREDATALAEWEAANK